MLPAIPTRFGGVKMHAIYQPAHGPGGDFYDVVTLDQGRFWAIMGDVSGHGVAAALLMSRISGEVRRLIRPSMAPNQLLAGLNEFLCSTDLDAFATAACVEVDQETRTLRVANAGHLPLIGRRRRNGEAWCFGQPSGAALGMVQGETYGIETIQLEPGDMIVLVTDGVTEAIDPRCDADSKKLLQLIASCNHDLGQVSQRIVGAAQAGRHEPWDDMALLAMELS